MDKVPTQEKLPKIERPVEISVIRGHQCYEVFSSFIDRLRMKYPENAQNDFPLPVVVRALEPKRQENADKSFVLYDASSNGQTVGVILGEEEGDTLRGYWYIIDPEFQNGQAKSNLINAADKDFKRITLLASVQGGIRKPRAEYEDINEIERDLISRQQALVRYYTKLGFKLDTTSPVMAYRHRQPYDPLPMVRENNNE